MGKTPLLGQDWDGMGWEIHLHLGAASLQTPLLLRGWEGGNYRFHRNQATVLLRVVWICFPTSLWKFPP